MKKWLVAMLGAAAVAFSAGALAQQQMGTGFYAGVDIGQAEIGSTDDTAIRLLGGYQFHRNIAAEIGYAQLIDKEGVDVTALELVALGIFPITNQFSVFGKLGLANVDVETPSGSDDKTELTYGIGVQFDFTRNLGVRAQWQRYDTDNEVDLLAVGVIWKF